MLTDVLRAAGGRLPVGEACGCAVQVAARLERAHEKGIVHRDLKPANLFVSADGVVDIRGMSFARFFLNGEHAHDAGYDEVVLDTADYLAPEQALDSASVDRRADIYSLGCVLYRLLTGRVPFSEGSVAQKLIWHQNREPIPPHTVRPEVPESLSRVLAKMMAKKPEGRYQSMTEVIAALRPFVVPAPPGICPAMAATALYGFA